MKTIFCYITALLMLTTVAGAQTKTVTLDYFFNRETRKAKDGTTERFHYTWEDPTFSGYSILGEVFKKNGAKINALEVAPAADNLKGTDVYIIVDPDTRKETENPNFIEAEHIRAIADWVKAGGVLVVFANDSSNVELEHLNKLTETFGIHFNGGMYHTVPNDKFDMGAFTLPENDPIFKTARKIYMKEIATLALSGNAKSALTDNGKVIIGTSKYGKGTVFAVGDPWIYNEYVNGRLPASFKFDNDKAADDMVKWFLSQARKK